MTSLSRIVLWLLAFSGFALRGRRVRAWNQWNYETQWVPIDPVFTVEGENTMSAEYWNKIWGTAPPQGIDPTNPIPGSSNAQMAPRPRRGHSLLHIKTRPDSIYKGYTYLIMFGGRDNEDSRPHIPKTYAVQKINGTLDFKTYDQKPVNPCNDIRGEYYSVSEREGCKYNSSSRIDVGASRRVAPLALRRLLSKASSTSPPQACFIMTYGRTASARARPRRTSATTASTCAGSGGGPTSRAWARGGCCGTRGPARAGAWRGAAPTVPTSPPTSPPQHPPLPPPTPRRNPPSPPLAGA